jgi:hypothetical protein
LLQFASRARMAICKLPQDSHAVHQGELRLL